MSFTDEMRRFRIEVDSLAAQFVRDGVPPYDAMERARDTVSRRRRDEARQRNAATIIGSILK